MSTDTGHLMTMYDVADQYGVSRSTIVRWLHNAEITRYRIAGDTRTWIDSRDLSRAVKHGTIYPARSSHDDGRTRQPQGH